MIDLSSLIYLTTIISNQSHLLPMIIYDVILYENKYIFFFTDWLIDLTSQESTPASASGGPSLSQFCYFDQNKTTWVSWTVSMVFPSTENEAVRNSAALRTEFARATSHPNRPHRSNLHSVKVPRGENTKSIQSKNVTSLLPKSNTWFFRA